MKILKYIIIAAALLVYSNATKAQGSSFRASFGYVNQTLNHTDKNTMLSLGYSFVLYQPETNAITLNIDYGFETPSESRFGSSFGTELIYTPLYVMNPTRFFMALGVGVRYQYDRTYFSHNPNIKSHAFGPCVEYRVYQYFFETGYLWGVNKVNLQDEDNGYMNSFFFKAGVYFPTNNNKISKKLDELSNKESF